MKIFLWKDKTGRGFTKNLTVEHLLAKEDEEESKELKVGDSTNCFSSQIDNKNASTN